MGIFSIFGRKKRVFSATKELKSLDEMPEEALNGEIRKQETLIRKQRLKYLQDKLQRLREREAEEILEEQIADLEDETEEEPETRGISPMESSPEMLITTLLAGLMKKNTQGSPPAQSLAQSPVMAFYDDNRLRELKAGLPPEYVNYFKKLTIEQKAQAVAQYMPGADASTINKAIAIMSE